MANPKPQNRAVFLSMAVSFRGRDPTTRQNSVVALGVNLLARHAHVFSDELAHGGDHSFESANIEVWLTPFLNELGPELGDVRLDIAATPRPLGDALRKGELDP